MAAPVADGLTAGIAQRHVSCAYGVYLCAQHLHALHVCVLTLHVGSSHEYLALHVHQRTDRCCCHTVLSSTRLRDDARLTHFLGQQNLSDGVVDLVGTRVVQVLTLQVELAAVLLTHALGKVERRGPAHVVFQQRMVSLLELRGFDDRQVGVLQVVYALVEYLRHVGTAELSVKSSFIYKIVFFHFYIVVFV